MKKLLVIIAGLILLGVGCKQEEWQGFYYPNGCLSCMEDYIYSPALSSLEECRNWGNGIRKERNNNPSDQYECGLNCKAKGVLRVCEEIVD
ncbi:MAG: hypothetical protein HYT15_04100 [Candidatus Magasanikbacteria bacterium]|nr:hypothetical protein [Candidatus Magasanikbacteria bacterium]